MLSVEEDWDLEYLYCILGFSTGCSTTANLLLQLRDAADKSSPALETTPENP